MYFSINPSKKDKEKWIVCVYPNIQPFIDCEFDVDTANKIANKMNRAYEMGVEDSREKIVDNLKDILFKD